MAAKKALAAGGDKTGLPEMEVEPLGGGALRRRLRHVTEMAIRGFDIDDIATCDGFILEVVAANAARENGADVIESKTTEEAEFEVLERSDVFQTRNPTWTPACGVRSGGCLNVFELRARAVRNLTVYWRCTVRLSELVPFCADLEELRALPPLRAPLLRLGEYWFTLPNALRAAGLPAVPIAALEPRRRGHAVKQIQASDICGVGDRLSVMLDRLNTLKAQTANLRESMESSLSERRCAQQRREQRILRLQKGRVLKQEVETRRQHLDRLRVRLTTSRALQAQQAESLQRAQEDIGKAKGDHAAEDFASSYSGVKSLMQQLRCRQMRMLYEVCEVYPVENPGRDRTIRRLGIARIDTLSRQDLREEESVSTALGFLAHFLVTLASIFGVPLRTVIHNAGCSRSYVSDPHETLGSASQAQEWPLYYGRGLEKSRFITALHLLRNGLHQFLYSRGYFDEKRLNGGNNLLECAEMIIKREL
eukprot:TRINITY_DN3585_c0_g1_i2.p1 TRINITY_DN3585_c0_g1~~TRINITY_DN3585_c0_g1_i2.p1  ORF type:complete len:530 (+),score=89.57 TRINITY_DN3585_c0_g1_i2:154-1590(+)